jgi:protein AroM
MVFKAGAILIGQTPRPDYEAYLNEHLPAGTQIYMVGALDELSKEAILSLPNEPDEEVLTTLARDGAQITIAARHIHERIPRLIHDLEAISTNLIILMCTGEFPDYPSRVPLLLPSRILTLNAVALAAGKRLSVVVPLLEQCDQLSKRWEAAGIHPQMHVFSPFDEAADVDVLCKEIRLHNPSLVILDCMGYRDDMKKKLLELLQRPVMSARSLLGHLLEEITD